MANLSTRKKVFICNLIISFLCIVSIASYFFLPFWKVKVSYTLTAETVQELIGDAMGDLGGEGGEGGSGDSSSESSSDEINYEDALGSIDLAGLVGDGITLELAISLKTQDILSSLTSDPAKLVETILTDNINSIVESLTPTIDQVAKNIVKTLAKMVLTEPIKAQVKEKLGATATDEAVQEELKNLGLTETYIDDKVSDFVDVLYQEDATVDSVADATLSIVEDVFATVRENSDEYKDLEFNDEMKADIKDTIVEILSEFANEDGSVNPDTVISDLLLGLLEGEKGGNEGSNDSNSDEGKPADGMAATASTTVILTNAQASDTASSSANLDEEAQDLSAQLTAALTSFLMDAVGDAAKTIAMVVQIISYVILFTFFTWFYLILKIVVKCRLKNPAIKLKLPIWLGSIPFWILYLIPTVALMVLANPPAALAEMMGAETVTLLTTLFSSLSINFFTCAWVSFAIGTFFFFFALFYYGKLRRRLRKMKKGLIPDDSVVFNDDISSEAPASENVAE